MPHQDRVLDKRKGENAHFTPEVLLILLDVQVGLAATICASVMLRCANLWKVGEERFLSSAENVKRRSRL